MCALVEGNADLNSTTVDGQTPLCLATASEQLPAVRLLLENRVMVDKAGAGVGNLGVRSKHARVMELAMCGCFLVTWLVFGSYLCNTV